MSKSAFDYIDDREKVLIGRGDLFMLLHTLVAYFGLNGAPVEFTVDCLQTICDRNMYNHDFLDSFMDFQKKMISKETNEELDKKMEELEKKQKEDAGVKEILSKMDETISDVFDWLGEDYEEKDDEEEEKQDN